MGIPYGSNRGRQKAGQIMKFLNDRSHYYSYQLGKTRGNFPLFKDSIYNLNGQYREKALAFYKEFLPEDEYEDLITSSSDGYMRNAATTTIAPTGTLSSLLNSEGYGAEPLFALGYIRKVLAGEKLIHTSRLFEDVAKRNGFYSKELMEKVAEKGTAQVDGVPKKWQEVFKCANDISYRDHILMQNELQKYCDSGISKTINMSADATIDDVDTAYKLAYKSQYIKGTTVYRDKSRQGAPINVGLVDYDNVKAEPIDIGEIKAVDRPKRTEGGTTSYKSGCGKLYLTVNHDNDGIIETFAFTGSSGGCQGLTEGISRAISSSIRLSRFYAEKLNLDLQKVTEGTLREIIDQLQSVRCNAALKNKNSEGKSCPDIIGKALENELNILKTKNDFSIAEVKDEVKKETEYTGGCSGCDNQTSCHTTTIKSKFLCPDCGAELHRAEGCMVCDCGYSKC